MQVTYRSKKRKYLPRLCPLEMGALYITQNTKLCCIYVVINHDYHYATNDFSRKHTKQ